eukprot:390865-Rhodomonas_salina.1
MRMRRLLIPYRYPVRIPEQTATEHLWGVDIMDSRGPDTAYTASYLTRSGYPNKQPRSICGGLTSWLARHCMQRSMSFADLCLPAGTAEDPTPLSADKQPAETPLSAGVASADGQAT